VGTYATLDAIFAANIQQFNSNSKIYKIKIDVRVIFLQTKTKLKTLVTRHLAL